MVLALLGRSSQPLSLRTLFHSQVSVYRRQHSQRLFSAVLSSEENKALEGWVASPPTHTLLDPLSLEHTLDLHITLPTRDGTRGAFEVPQTGTPLPYGYHLAYFGARRAEGLLRADGTDEDISPPPPFTKRMWAGGRITWNVDNPLLIGKPAKATSTVLKAERKGFDKGKPMFFVTQNIEVTQDNEASPCISEQRSHVYFHAGIFANRKKVFDRPVEGIPTHGDFSFTYTPTPVTLFRYSALMFNAHHIHLDKEYCQNVEGYPERLVHGPLTAQMLLETVVFRNPGAKIQQFEYRATNPLFVNDELIIHGKWMNQDTIKLWCQDGKGIVGMTGSATVAQ